MTRLVKTKENINGLPIGFQEVEYLHSNGNQYIDTEVLGNGEFDVDYQFYQTENSANAIFAGTRSASQHLNFGQRSTGNAGGFSMAYLGEYWQAISSPAINTNVRVQISYKNGSQTGALNGTAMTGKSLTGTEATNLSIYLFKRHHYGTDNVSGLVGRIYYFKLWNNGALVRNFIPCLDAAGRPCMYDLVGKKAYYNLGTGEFTYGRKIIPVEYLESAGSNNYIATGLNYFADYEIGIKLRNNVSNKALGNSATNCMQRYNATNPYWSFTSSGTNSFTPNALITDYHVMKWKDGKIYTDDVLITEKAKDKGTTEMTLFGAGTYFPNMIYFCKLWNPDDGTLVRDYLPAIDENGVAFMFDRVTHTIFDNAGTGTFSYGNPIYTTKTRLVKEPLLPNGFKRVEYLESSGTQYIDTGIAGSSTLTLEMIAQKSGSGYGVYFGAGTGNNRIQAIYFSDYNNARIGNINSNLGPDSEKFNVVVDALNKNVIYNGTSYPFAYTSALSNLNIFIFTRNEGSSYADKATAKCWSFKIFDNGIIVRDFIPCLDANSTPCMYDTVTQTAFYNQGSGSFTYGNILPYETKTRLIPSWLDGYTFVNYIQSTGTQYIDTGFKVDDTCGYDIKWMALNADDRIIMGTKGAGDSRWVLSGSNNPHVNISWNTPSGDAGLGLNKIQTAQMNYLNDRKRLLNGIEKTPITETLSSSASTYNVGIFAGCWGSGTFSLFSTCRIYYAKITKGQEVIANYIPAIRKSDSAVGMLDIVNRVFYTNQGTGVFSYG